MAKKKKNNQKKLAKIALIVVMVVAGFWLQSKLVVILGDLQATVFSDFNMNPAAEEAELPIPPITIIERHYIEVEVPPPTPTPARVYSGGGSVSPKGSGPLPGSFAAGIN